MSELIIFNIPFSLAHFVAFTSYLGHIPKELGELGNLEGLGLQTNQLSGDGIHKRQFLSLSIVSCLRVGRTDTLQASWVKQ